MHTNKALESGQLEEKDNNKNTHENLIINNKIKIQ